MDAGCGTGRLTAELLKHLPRGWVVGVDLSQNMLAGARDYLARDFEGKFSLVVADLQYLPFERVFDGIFSTAAFHWVLNHDRLFRSLFRALRPGGWLRAQCGCGPNLARLRKRTDDLAATPKYARYFAAFSEPGSTTMRKRPRQFYGGRDLPKSIPAWNPRRPSWRIYRSIQNLCARSFCVNTWSAFQTVNCALRSSLHSRTKPRPTIPRSRWITGGST